MGANNQPLVRRINSADIRKQRFASGSMGPKVEAAAAFVENGEQMAGMGILEDARAIIEKRAGTQVAPDDRRTHR